MLRRITDEMNLKMITLTDKDYKFENIISSFFCFVTNLKNYITVKNSCDTLYQYMDKAAKGQIYSIDCRIVFCSRHIAFLVVPISSPLRIYSSSRRCSKRMGTSSDIGNDSSRELKYEITLRNVESTCIFLTAIHKMTES